jgi:hypothetical protein
VQVDAPVPLPPEQQSSNAWYRDNARIADLLLARALAEWDIPARDVEALIIAGADVNAGPTGDSVGAPLEFAQEEGRKDVTLILRKHGARLQAGEKAAGRREYDLGYMVAMRMSIADHYKMPFTMNGLPTGSDDSSAGKRSRSARQGPERRAVNGR